jgi:putative transposase
MSRQPRVVVPELPHHVTQRGNRGAPIFFEAGDEQVYLDLLARECRRREVEIWAYCLCPTTLISFSRLGRRRGSA